MEEREREREYVRTTKDGVETKTPNCRFIFLLETDCGTTGS